MQPNDPATDALDAALNRLYRAETPPPSFETGWRAAVRREETIQMTSKQPKRAVWRAAAPAFAALVLVLGSLWAGTLDMPGKTANDPTTTAESAAYRSAAKMSANDGVMMEATYDVQADYAAGSGLQAAPQATQRKLIRSAGVTLHTAAFEADAQRVQELLAQLGGYVENLYQYGDTESGRARTLSLNMRVPADRLDTFLEGAQAIGRVTDRNESTTDMTVQYADNAARLKTLRDKMARLQELLAQAESVSDLVEIEGAIADTQYQLDSYETAQRDIDRRVDMSSVNVTVVEDTPSATNEEITLGERMQAGLKASVKWLGQFFRNMLVFVVMALPVIVPVTVIAVVAWIVVQKRRKAKK